jgi:hypothetical protein
MQACHCLPRKFLKPAAGTELHEQITIMIFSWAIISFLYLTLNPFNDRLIFPMGEKLVSFPFGQEELCALPGRLTPGNTCYSRGCYFLLFSTFFKKSLKDIVLMTRTLSTSRLIVPSL